MIPVLIGAAAIGLGIAGIKKGLDAKEKNELAEMIIEDAKELFNDTKQQLEEESEILKQKLIEYGEFKLKVFNEVIGHYLKLMTKCAKKTSSEVNIKKYLTKDEIIELENINAEAVEITNSLAKGVNTGAAVALGMYGAVGTFATASTGTAIASLSGAAATNATLAWLGGGSLAAGGLGIAGGTAVLGSLLVGPAIAIAGFTLDSKAEENLTKAKKFKAEVEEKVEKMKFSIEEYKLIKKYIDESIDVVENLIDRYLKMFENAAKKQEEIYIKLINEYNQKIENLKNNANFIKKFLFKLGIVKVAQKPIKPEICQLEEFKYMTYLVKELKNILQAPLMDSRGNRNKKFIEIIDKAKLEFKGE